MFNLQVSVSADVTELMDYFQEQYREKMHASKKIYVESKPTLTFGTNIIVTVMTVIVIMTVASNIKRDVPVSLTPISPTPVSPIPISPTPIWPTVKYNLIPISPTQ